MTRAIFLFAVTSSLAACGGGGGTDGGPRVDAPTGQDGGGYPFPDLPALEGFDAVSSSGGTSYRAATLDIGCVGAATQPAAGSPIAATFEALEFRDRTPYPGNLQVWFFNDNIVRGTCDPPMCQLLSLDPDTGRAPVMTLAGGWYAYSILAASGATPGTTVFSFVQANETAATTANAVLEGRWVSALTANVLTAAGGFMREEGTAVIAGAVLDCRGDDARLAGSIIRFFSPDGSELFNSPRQQDLQLRYFAQSGTTSSPSEDALHTSENGLFMVAQVPPADGAYRIEAWGRASAGGPIELLGCEEVGTRADGIAVVNIGPLRSDGPASCSASR